jgi:hypothetical protein
MQLLSHPQAYHDAVLNQRDQPNALDIVCERGKAFRSHLGNHKFSEAIRSNVQRYHKAEKRRDKSQVVATVISSLKEEGHRFVKLDKKSKRYYEIGEHLAHEKTGHALRDLLKVWGRSNRRSRNLYDRTEDPTPKKTAHVIRHDLLNTMALSNLQQPKRCSDGSEVQAHDETGNAVRDLLELRNRQNKPSTIPSTMVVPPTMAVASPRSMTYSFDLVGESNPALPSTMVVASPGRSWYGAVGGSDLDATTIMMGRGRGSSRLLRRARTHRRSFVVCFPTKW